MPQSPLAVNSTSSAKVPACPTRFGNGAVYFGLLVLAVCWGFVFNELRVDWTTNPQYGYGWFVPVLALGLFRLRWNSRPKVALSTTTLMPAAMGLAALV